ncbi:hypothetical protein FB192DRAFT_1350263 [Mucor lusitanicus]|uniref:Threonine/serine exporter-like N-terminal domain-containing protein n=2 Tax=Mucor circinelloides f. lusitanicus TaxID=29924 RepID=A0A168K5Y6_MUCCL|nr:hypothetical protein FB192DRAFT_1350263 [Mucor lusitanicus]OAD02033.1 hypothetical protein MUCCIDRAFT_111383 [Mucor lusitanicus CBS 277.49]
MECTHHDEKLAAGHHSHNGKRIKKKNSRSKSMFELADNPYADENCCCCNDDHVDASATSTATTRRNSLIYSILTSSTLNHHNDVYTHTATTTSDAMLFLLKFSKLLVSCGAPSHRLDHCLQSLMQKFSVKAQFGYFPGFLVVSFGDAENLAASVQIIKAEATLDLHKLTLTYQLFESVLCDEISLQEAIDQLDPISRDCTLYPAWLTWLAYAVASSVSAPLFFSGGAVDMGFGLLLGLIVAVGFLHVSKRVTRFGSIFDVLLSAIVGFIASSVSARFPTTTSCFYALSVGGVVTLLPGYTTLISILEIAAGEVASGTLRLTTTLIYSLMIGFGLAIGASCHKIMFPSLALVSADTQQCENDISAWYHFLFVPLFALANLIILKGHPRKFPVILTLAAVSHSVHYFSLSWFVSYQHVATVMAAFAVALLSNFYARFKSTIGFVDMITGLLFLVPGSVGVSSSLSSFTSSAHANEISIILNASQQGVIFATHMMVITVAVSVGLVLAAVVVYPVRKIVDYRRKTPRYRRRNWVGEITF